MAWKTIFCFLQSSLSQSSSQTFTKDILGSSATSPLQPELPGKSTYFKVKKEAQFAATYEPEMYTKIKL